MYVAARKYNLNMIMLKCNLIDPLVNLTELSKPTYVCYWYNL
jgi:hypothetical protein